MFKLDGEAEPALIEAALTKANEHFNGAQLNSAFSFALSYLASLIVIYERSGLGGPRRAFSPLTELSTP